MSRVMEEAMFWHGYKIQSVPEKSVCIKHFEDKAIQRFIRQNRTHGYCGYCEKELKVVSYDELLPFIMSGIQRFYCDAGEFMTYETREGGYQGQIYSADELIQDLVQLRTDNFQVIQDIVNSIEEISWSEPDLYHNTDRDELMYQWSNFVDLIKHESRYFFMQNSSETDTPTILQILKAITKVIVQHRLVKKLARGSVFYRCIQHSSVETIDAIGRIVAPPKEHARFTNRFSPSGISMLYAGFSPHIAKLETFDESDNENRDYTIADLELKNEIHVIDFTSLPNIPSIFDEKKSNQDFYLIQFLYDFVNELTKAVRKDGLEHIDYVPTQVVTEYFKFPLNKNRKNKIQGIIYPSSKNPTETCIVLFWDNEQCIERLNLLALQTSNVNS